MKESRAHEIFSIRQCDHGCVALNFGHTTIHLDAHRFAQFSEVFEHFTPALPVHENPVTRH